MDLKGLVHGSRTLRGYHFREPIHIAVKRPSKVLLSTAAASPAPPPVSLVDETITVQTMDEWFALIEKIITKQVITPVDMGLQALPQIAMMTGVLVKDEEKLH